MAVAFGASLGTGAAGATPAATWSLTTTATVPAGGHVIVAVGWFHATATVTLSGGGLTWTQDVVFGTGSRNVAIFSSPAPAGLPSGTVITATATIASNTCGIAAMYATGVATSSWKDVSGTGSAASGAAWSASLTTTFADTLIVAFGWVDFVLTTSSTVTDTEWSDFQNTVDTNTFSGVYRIVSSTGTYTPGGSWAASGANPSVTAAVAYKAAVVVPPNDAKGGWAPAGVFDPELNSQAWF